ncbi:MAG: GGDEF domain-containing response regulator [Aliiglaciecola sp.]
MNILLVDDDLVDREIVKRAISRHISPEKLIEVNTAQEGLDALELDSFDIVLLDYMMPNLNGLEMMKVLRSRPKLGNAAIVMMSASGDEKLALKCLQAGAQDFLPKDEISASKLTRAIFQAQKRFELESKLFESYCRVREMAETDSLTGLSNRYHFERSLNTAVRQNTRGKSSLALLLLDLDHFKNINDTFGHELGDELLQEVVKKIAACLRGEEVFARLGGDEFAIVLSDLGHARDADLVARRIVKALEQPVSVREFKLQTGVSIGIALHPDNADSSKELVRFADIAMYQAKHLGRNQFCFFQDIMQQQFSRTFQIELELKKATKEKDFELHFQPVLAGKDQELTGFEALIRWPSCTHKCTPDEFIPMAEQSLLINEIGNWVLDTALETLARWQQNYHPELTMAVNFSARQLEDENLLDVIKGTLKKHQIEARHLTLEITETALLDDNSNTKKTIDQLDVLGCKLALDDFGTGYSSLSHLVNYPIAIVKLDKSMLPTNPSHARHMAIVRGMSVMSHIVGLKVIAEGVENAFQFSLCKDLSIAEFQGYFFGKPLSGKDIEAVWFGSKQASVKLNH